MAEMRPVLSRNMQMAVDEPGALDRAVELIDKELGSYSPEIRAIAAIRLADIVGRSVVDVHPTELFNTIGENQLSEDGFRGLSGLTAKAAVIRASETK